MLDLDLSSVFTEDGRRHGLATVDVLIVCTGNVCRSPLAAQLLRARLSDLDVTIGSAGTYGQVGDRMDRSAVKVAGTLGVPREESRAHRGRWLSDFHLSGTDAVFTMTARQLARVAAMMPGRADLVFTVREFARLAAQVTDDDIITAADAAGDAPARRVRAALRTIAARRDDAGLTDADEVVDPHRQPYRVFEQAAAEMLPGVDAIARVLRLALTDR